MTKFAKKFVTELSQFHIFSSTLSSGLSLRFINHIYLLFAKTLWIWNGQCKTKTADCGPGVKCRLCVKCRLETESKTQAGVKCRPSINCSRRRVQGPKTPANTSKRTLPWRHLLSQMHSGLSSLERRRRPKNIIAILNLFSVRETSLFNFRREVFVTSDRELVQHHDVYA